MQDDALVFDDHRYIKWSNVGTSKDEYMKTSCHDTRVGLGTPLMVGEWSLSVASSVEQDSDWDPKSNAEWYAGWFAAQARSYEKQYGWVFWTWKANVNDPRWSYKDAVAAGIIPKNLDDSYQNNACDGY